MLFIKSILALKAIKELTATKQATNETKEHTKLAKKKA